MFVSIERNCSTSCLSLKTSSSDVGLISVIKEEPDLKIIHTVQDLRTSYVLHDESCLVLVKNTGNQSVDLDINNIKINESVVTEYEFISGIDSSGKGWQGEGVRSDGMAPFFNDRGNSQERQ